MSTALFNPQVFFIVFRETLEAVIIIATLLAFVKQSLIGEQNKALRSKLNKQIWWGAATGVLICLVIGGGFIGAYYSLGSDIWSSAEDLWEGIFSIIATVLISAMGITMLRINKMQEKWRIKIARSLTATPAKRSDRFKFGYLCKKYAMWILPFLTTLREGVEAIVFVGGVGIGTPAKSFPIPVITGLLAGILVGYILYKAGSGTSLQIFLCISTCILYLISSGLFSKAVWYFETNEFNHKTGGDASEQGDGNGSYDISKSVWHVNCCNPELDNGWDVFNSLLGWQNSATYGSVISYNIYWLVLILVILLLLYQEKHGHLPGTKNLTLQKLNPMYYIKHKDKNELTKEEQQKLYAEANIRIRETAAAEQAAADGTATTATAAAATTATAAAATTTTAAETATNAAETTGTTATKTVAAAV